MTRISVIIATMGRSTLGRTVDSITANLRSGDELIIIPDIPASGAWGTKQYDHGADIATGDYLLFFTDDDFMPLGALDAVRAGVTLAPWSVHVFSMLMHHWSGRILRNSMDAGNVGGQQIVVPRGPRAFWRANTTNLNDHAFLVASLAIFGQRVPVYHDDIICEMSAHNAGRML